MSEAQQATYRLIQDHEGVPVKAWVHGVHLEDAALKQLQNVARLPFIHGWVAAMPDVHWGLGATVGSVIPTVGAVIPAAVGVDIGCGMMACQTSLTASNLPDSLRRIREEIEKAVPHGRSSGHGRRDKGSWNDPPLRQQEEWANLLPRFKAIQEKHPRVSGNTVVHLGTLGTGNHFIELCLDEADRVWIMLHSGSRGIGNAIGRYFIELAKEDMGAVLGELPDRDLAYLTEGTRHFDDYVEAVEWAQDFARINRRLMMEAIVRALENSGELPPFTLTEMAVNCHHNYISREVHFGRPCLVTRKGAVRAGKNDLGIIPGSMGAKSYIVRGLGNPESFESCSHGAGRMMSRNEARKRFTVEDHMIATEGVECRKDEGVIDETPAAYKNIDAVMEAQKDLVEVVHTLRQVVCVKG